MQPVDVPKGRARKVLARGADNTPVVLCDEPSCHLCMIFVIGPARNDVLLLRSSQQCFQEPQNQKAGATLCSWIHQMASLPLARRLGQRMRIEESEDTSTRKTWT